MYTKYLILAVFIIQTVKGFNPNRHALKNGNSNNQEQVIPARYQIKNTRPNYDPTIAENVHFDNFPEVEYPISIVDSAKPFYINVNPFSNDVKSTFHTLVAGAPTKLTPTIVLNLKSDENKKEKIKPETSTQGSGISDIAIEKEYEISLKSKNETEFKAAWISNSEDNIDVKTEDKQLCNLSDDEEVEYVIGFIDDLGEFIITLTDIETELLNSNDAEAKMVDVEPHEGHTIKTSDVELGNNGSATELNKGTLYTEANPNPVKFNDSSTVTSLLKGTTMTSFLNETQGDIAVTEQIDDDNDSSWFL